MCLSLERIADGQMVPCRNCWQCRETRVNDLIGRCIAESQTSTATVAVTLTYAGDSPSAAVLVYPDFQKFIKRLRRKGYPCRYIVAGEYGSKKGRAHWHAVLFFKSDPPPLPRFDTQADWSFWTNSAEGRGFVYLQEPDYHGFKYVLKYVLKDQSAKVSTNVLSMSKKPPLGYDYFMQLADDYVAEKLSPQHGGYSFRGVKSPNGKHRIFRLRGRMKELFSEAYIIKYRSHYGTEYPFSDFLLEQEDDWCRAARTFNDDELIQRFNYRPVKYVEPPPDYPGTLLGFTVFPEHGDLLLEARDNGFSIFHERGDEWRVNDASLAVAALEALGVPSDKARKACATHAPKN